MISISLYSKMYLVSQVTEVAGFRLLFKKNLAMFFWVTWFPCIHLCINWFHLVTSNSYIVYLISISSYSARYLVSQVTEVAGFRLL